MANEPLDNGYEEVSYPEARVSEGALSRSLFLPIALSVLKRPWLTIGAIFLMMVPIIFYLYSQVSLYRSSTIVSIAIKDRGTIINALENAPFGSGRAVAEEYYYYILDGHAFRNGVAQRVMEAYPHLPPDSVSYVVNSSIRYSKKPRTTGFLFIQAESESPEFSKFLAQEAVTSFKELSIRLRRSDDKLVVEFIDSQINELNAKLADNDSRLQTFLSEQKLSLDDVVGDGSDSELSTLERNLSEAEASRDMARLQIANYTHQIEKRLNRYLLSDTDQANHQLSNLRSRLDRLGHLIADSLENYTDTLALRNLQAERKQVLSELIARLHSRNNGVDLSPELRQVSLQALEYQLERWMIEHENSLASHQYFQSALNHYLAEHPNLSKDILEYYDIQRTKDVHQKTIDILVNQHESLRIKMAAEGGGIKVIDSPHLPIRPIQQYRGRKLTIAFIIALALGIGLAYMVDMFDNTIQGEDDITNRFNLPVYGSIPVLDIRGYRARTNPSETGSVEEERAHSHAPLRGDGAVDFTLLDNHSESSPAAEAYRSIKTAIMFTARDRQRNTFVISSAIAGEGKSLTTYNLGVSFAQGGSRVLIVDSDLRRSSQHKLFDIQRTPGLADYLFEEASLDEIVHTKKILNLSVIPAGRRVNNPADLLSSKRMHQFIGDISPNYDIVLLDSPPTTPCMDSRTLANITGGMIFIVRTEMTKLNVLDLSFNLSRRVAADILGVIVNHASFKYGYGYYYLYQRYNPYGYSGYQYYYHYYHDADSDKEVKRRRRRSGVSSSEPIA